jgi:hypothetical protein
MRSTFAFLVTCTIGLGGCASGGAFHQQLDFAVMRPGLHVGGGRVLGENVNPLVPLSLEASEGGVAVTFGQRNRSESVRVDPSSLDLLERVDGPAAPRAPLAGNVARVVLPGGASLVVSRRGDAEVGYQAVVQTFNASGMPTSASVSISSPEVDVVGPLEAVFVDDNHIVAAFTAAIGETFEVVAVPIEVL